nr:MAG TPA: Terminase small subunit [Caudoviricetes sp.]
MNNYELAKIDYSNGMSTKEIAEKYNVSVATVRKWKSRHNWDSVTKKRDKNVTSKKAKEVAKILVEEGATIREASAQSGTSIDVVKKISAKENLQQSQLEYLKEFRNNQRKKIRENKLKRLMLNDEILEAIEYELSNWQENGRVSKAAIEKLLMSEELEQKIFELDRIERLEKLEIDKKKATTEQSGAEKKLDQYINTLMEALDEE